MWGLESLVTPVTESLCEREDSHCTVEDVFSYP